MKSRLSFSYRLLLGIAFSLSALQLFSSSAAAAAAAAVTATISSVAVYADRAVVTRRAHLDLPAGPGEVTFDQLPKALLDASVQVSGHGLEDLKILDVATHITHTTEFTDPNEKPIEDRLIELHKADHELDVTANSIAHRLIVLGQIETVALAPAPAAGTPVASRLNFDQWNGLLDFSNKNAQKLTEEQAKLDHDRTENNALIAAEEAKLNDLRGSHPGPKSYKTVTVRLEAGKAGTLDLDLTCTLPNASWAPVYDARLHSEKKTVTLGYFGLVRNATGEDWNGVALTLSTARPALGGGTVEPGSWIVDVEQPVVPRPYYNEPYLPSPSLPDQVQRGQDGQLRSNPASISVALAGTTTFTIAGGDPGTVSASMAGPGSPPAMTAAWDTAEVDHGATSATFTITDPATLPADNTPHRVAIMSVELPAQLQYQAIPSDRETAFLSAYVTNATEFPLLAGTLNVFLDQDFVAASQLEATTMPTERFQLALGADEGIAIKRKLVNRLTETVGFTSKTTRITYEYLITVTNNKPLPERVMFKDVLPQSRDGKIMVKLLEPAERELAKAEDLTVPNQLPKPGIVQEEDGKIVWREDIAPGKTGERKFTFKFSVEYPNDLEVVGLH